MQIKLWQKEDSNHFGGTEIIRPKTQEKDARAENTQTESTHRNLIPWML